MGLTVEELKNLAKPYDKLGTADLLVENREELNQLSADEKRDLATRLILDCPEDKLSGFFHEIEAARVPQNDQESFHESLTQAFEVRKRLLALADAKNQHPYNLLLDEELDEGLFNSFKGLAVAVLKEKESQIAKRLALVTPDETCSTLARNVSNMFSGTSFAAKVGAAFAMRREIKMHLLGNNPEAFFSSPELRDQDGEFNIDLCNEFSDLFPSLLKDHEKSIGEKLALIESNDTRSKIGRTLELLNTAAHQQDSPFRLIAAAMNPQRGQQKQEQAAKSNEQEKTATATAPASAPQSAPAAPSQAFFVPAGDLRQRSAVKPTTPALDVSNPNADYDSEEETPRRKCGCF